MPSMFTVYGEQVYSKAPGVRPCLRASQMYWSRLDVLAYIPTEEASSPVLLVKANHGRWVVECPACNDAQIPCRSDLFFFCMNCLNAMYDGKLLPIQWPNDYMDIANELEKRDNVKNKNWNPGETINMLAKEHKEHVDDVAQIPDFILDNMKKTGTIFTPEALGQAPAPSNTKE